MLFFPLCSSPLKVKEDDEVDRLEIKIDTSKRPRRTYPSPSPEVAMKISRSLRVSDAFLQAENTCYRLLDTVSVSAVYGSIIFLLINVVHMQFVTHMC